ncbi:MAG: hypothetical protein N2652_10375 [Kiritimatiellae bacterium]|nr:hypothetical protein [Kiritimatiellia bacterium]
MKRLALWIARSATVGALQACAADALPPREFEVKLDGEPVSGKQVVTVRFTPMQSRTYDMLTFECVLRQEYMQTDSAGRTRRRVVEPAVFTHRERGVKFVEALDKHISFWVPISVERLREAFGETLFVASAPVTIHKVVIRAYHNGDVVWTVESPPGAGPKTAPADAAGSGPKRDKYGLPEFRGGRRP